MVSRYIRKNFVYRFGKIEIECIEVPLLCYQKAVPLMNDIQLEDHSALELCAYKASIRVVLCYRITLD
jgi:hypothetical protein